jgi:hypothetical protein
MVFDNVIIPGRRIEENCWGSHYEPTDVEKLNEELDSS